MFNSFQNRGRNILQLEMSVIYINANFAQNIVSSYKYLRKKLEMPPEKRVALSVSCSYSCPVRIKNEMNQVIHKILPYHSQFQLAYRLIKFGVLSQNCAVYEIMWKNTVQPDRPQMTMWRISNACWILTATNTQSGYAILFVCPLLQRLYKGALMLHYAYTICRVIFCSQKNHISSFDGHSARRRSRLEHCSLDVLVCDCDKLG